MVSGEAGPELSPSGTVLDTLDHCFLPEELLDAEHRAGTLSDSWGPGAELLQCPEEAPAGRVWLASEDQLGPFCRCHVVEEQSRKPDSALPDRGKDLGKTNLSLS